MSRCFTTKYKTARGRSCAHAVSTVALLHIFGSAHAACDAGDRPPTPTMLSAAQDSDGAIALRWRAQGRWSAHDLSIDFYVRDEHGKPLSLDGGTTPVRNIRVGGGVATYERTTRLLNPLIGKEYWVSARTRAGFGRDGCLSPSESNVVKIFTMPPETVHYCMDYANQAAREHYCTAVFYGCIPGIDGRWNPDIQTHLQACLNDRRNDPNERITPSESAARQAILDRCEAEHYGVRNPMPAECNGVRPQGR